MWKKWVVGKKYNANYNFIFTSLKYKLNYVLALSRIMNYRHKKHKKDSGIFKNKIHSSI